MNDQIHSHLYYQVEDPKPDREKREKADTKKFWCLWVPAGILAGFIGCLIGDSGAYFIPVGGVTTLLLWAAFAGSSE